jgi:hypothetical protein
LSIRGPGIRDSSSALDVRSWIGINLGKTNGTASTTEMEETRDIQ